MSSANFANKTIFQQKLAFNMAKLKEVAQSITQQVKCQTHNNMSLIILINHVSFPSKIGSVRFNCQKCVNLQKVSSYYLFENIVQMAQFCLNLQRQSQQGKTYIAELKKQIKEYLYQKRIRKIQWASYFDCLNEQMRQFFLKQDQLSQPDMDLNQEVDSFRIKYIEQLKYWIKNPDQFKQTFCIECQKSIIQKILWIKHNIDFFSSKIKSIFIQFNIVGDQFDKIELLKLFCNKKKVYNIGILNKIKLVVQRQRQKADQVKINILRKTYASIRIQTNLQKITEDLRKFIKLYENTLSNYNYYKFNVVKNNDHFSTNIIENIVSLRQANINKTLKVKYETLKYQSQFQGLDDGQFVFHNQFRDDIFYDRLMDLSRNITTVVGQQYLYNKSGQYVRTCLNMMDEQPKYIQRIVQLNKPINSHSKVFLKLRLNFEMQGILKIGVRWSSSYSNSLQDIRDNFKFVKLKIIPDLSNQKKQKQDQALVECFPIQDQFSQNQNIFKSQSMFIKTRQVSQSHQLGQGFQGDTLGQVSMQEEDEIIYQVIQDDEISLGFNQKKKQLVYYNQSQRKYICFKSLEICEWFQFQHGKHRFSSAIKTLYPLYPSICLASSVPEIEILEK